MTHLARMATDTARQGVERAEAYLTQALRARSDEKALQHIRSAKEELDRARAWVMNVQREMDNETQEQQG